MLEPGTVFWISFVVGGALGLVLRRTRFGCWSLGVIPIGAYLYTGAWQSQQETLRSTSGLMYLFIQFPALIGALAGYALVAFIREWRA